MTALSHAISEGLFHFLWQGTIAGCLLWIVLTALRRRSAQTRYLVACAGLFLLLVLPVVTSWRAYQPTASIALGTLAPAIQAAAGFRPETVWQWVVPLWAFGVGIFSLRFLQGCRHISRLRAAGEDAGESIRNTVQNLKARMGIRKGVDILACSVSEVPCMIGWLKPAILVPAATIAGLTPEQMEAILAHELAHLRRHDYIVNIGQMVVETLLFYHPAVWWVSRQIRHERELCCDDLVVASIADPLTYARALTVVEKIRVKTPAFAMGSTHGPLVHRIERLMSKDNPDFRPSRAAGVAVFLLLAMSSVGLSMNWSQAQNTTPPAENRTGNPVTSPPPSSLSAIQGAVDFLKAELSKAGSALEKAEEKQIRAQSKQFSLEAEKAKITELQKALTTVRIANIQKSAVAIVAKEQGGLLEDARIADLHTQDAALATSFPANSPTRMAIRAQIDTLAAAEMQRRQADQQVSEVQERLLAEELNVTLAHATETQNEIETFKREVASARRVYEELQERLAKAQLSLSLENR